MFMMKNPSIRFIVDDEDDLVAKKYFKAWHMRKGTRLAREKIHHGSISEVDGGDREELLTNRTSFSDSDVSWEVLDFR